MNIDTCVKAIKESKKYGFICEETIIRIVQNEIGKHKSEKDVIKSVKTKLHQITGAFVGEDSIKQALRLLDTLNKHSVSDTIKKILALHISSMERMRFIDEMYKDIFDITGNQCSILDVACGFNPFCLPLFSKFIQKKYYATDIYVKIIDLLNRFFDLADVNGCAFANDVLYKTPDVQVQNVFLFKIIPLLEQQQKGYSKILVNQLNSEFFTITFPTKSLSEKNVGMYQFYDAFMKNCFTDNEFEYCLQKEYLNELLYIIKRRRQSG